MRTLLALIALFGAALALPGDLQAKLEQKLAKPFVKNAAWELDYDAACKKAKESNKLIFGYFTRSYAP